MDCAKYEDMKCPCDPCVLPCEARPGRLRYPNLQVPPAPKKLYSTKQTPRGSVVVLGDRIISEHEMPTDIAQQQADWLNHRKSAR
jgi:hypothetical protein